MSIHNRCSSCVSFLELTKVSLQGCLGCAIRNSHFYINKNHNSMKKIFTCILSLILALSTISAEKVRIGELYYLLNERNSTAKVTCQVDAWYGTTTYDNYNGLTSATIPETVSYNNVTYNVTGIGDKAFYQCRSLVSVTIPNSITVIESEAFRTCINLTSAPIPNSVTNIGGYAFYDCNSLGSIDIPNSVTNIGWWAFGNCNTASSVSISNSLKSIPEGCFCNCSNISAIIIPDSIIMIDANAFSSTSISSITIPEKVSSIGYNTFWKCSKLSKVTFANNVRSLSIGSGVFAYCNKLDSIILPNGLYKIGREAFKECTNLKFVSLPKSLTQISSFAFDNCSALTTIFNYADTPITLDCVFWNVDQSKCALYVPQASLEAYQEATEWKEFNPILPIPGLEAVFQTTVREHHATKTVYKGQILIQNGEKKYTITGAEIK